MTQVGVSAAAAKQIAAADGPVNIVDETGTVIAYCTPIEFPHSLYSRGEVERRWEEARKNPGAGKSLAEAMEHLRNLGGNRS